MKIQIVAQYYWPEQVGAGVWLRQLAGDLALRGHDVTMVTALPNYPEGRVFEGYRGRWIVREKLDGVRIIRTWIYASREKKFFPRAWSFGSFCATAMLGSALAPKPDVVYCVLPPLPLGASAQLVATLRGTPTVINLQDIYPEIAVRLGYLRNRRAIRFFEAMERFIYRRASRIVVITESFRENLLRKGVAPEKLHVIPNWADGDEIRPGPRENDFRARAGLNGEFCVVYSGGLGHNSQLDPVIEAAKITSGEPHRYLIIGDGPRRAALQARAAELSLHNVRFLPYQPAELYPQVLAASDVQIVSLHPAATDMSLPSKALKILASGRPMIAVARKDCDLTRLVRAAGCGFTVEPDDAEGLADAVRRLAASPPTQKAMGVNARRYFLQHFERGRCVDKIESVLTEAAKE
jgi:colanic acid biosynthesis glycosyl transferase WcaI